MKGLKRPTKSGIKFQIGDIKEKEVDNFVKKARAKSSRGRMECRIRYTNTVIDYDTSCFCCYVSFGVRATW